MYLRYVWRRAGCGSFIILRHTLMWDYHGRRWRCDGRRIRPNRVWRNGTRLLLLLLQLECCYWWWCMVMKVLSYGCCNVRMCRKCMLSGTAANLYNIGQEKKLLFFFFCSQNLLWEEFSTAMCLSNKKTCLRNMITLKKHNKFWTCWISFHVIFTIIKWS